MLPWSSQLTSIRRALEKVESMMSTLSIPTDHLSPSALLNYHPPASRAPASNFLASTETMAGCVFDALGELNKLTSALQAAVATHRARMANSRSHALALPAEVLERIFIYATALDSGTGKKYKKKTLFRALTPMVFSHVCQDWRTTSILLRPLWRHIVLPMPPFLLDLYVKRARKSSLHVTIWRDTNRPCIANAKAYGYGIDLSDNPARFIKRPNLSHIQSRISELSMLVNYDMDSMGTCPWLGRIFDSVPGLESLETLSITVDDAESNCMAYVYPIHAPALRCVALTSASYHPLDSSPVKQLRYNMRSSEQLGTILSDIEAYRHAESLDVSIKGIDLRGMHAGDEEGGGTLIFEQPPALEFQHLRQLKFHHADKFDCEAAMILHFMAVPRLEKLVLKELETHMDHECRICEEYQLEEVLMEERFDSVTELELQGTACAIDTISKLMASMCAKQVAPFPRLERLIVRTSPGASDSESDGEEHIERLLEVFQGEYAVLRGGGFVLDVSVDVVISIVGSGA